MSNDEDTGQLRFVVPAHTLTGDVQQLLAEIDDTIGALEIIRAEVLARAPKPARPMRLRWWKRLAHGFERLVPFSPGDRRTDSRSMAR